MAKGIIINTNYGEPWSKLGTSFNDNPTLEEARVKSGLDWNVEKKKVLYEVGPDTSLAIPGAYAVVRSDNNHPLGIVSKNYTPYQNSEMFDLVGMVQKEIAGTVEACGCIRGGRTVWAVLKVGDTEYIKEDVVGKYFFIKNTFDGTSAIEMAFTDIRMVCMNAYSAAIKHATNIWRVAHVTNLETQLQSIHQGIGAYALHDKAMHEVMTVLAKTPMSDAQIQSQVLQFVAKKGQEPTAVEDLNNYQQRAYGTIRNLIESGAGTDIKRVRGTAYGTFQAIVEYVDHYRPVSGGENFPKEEARFESTFIKKGRDLKATAFADIFNFAQAA